MPSLLRALLAPLLLAATLAHGQQHDKALLDAAHQEAPAVLETLRALTSVDSGTGQAPGMLAVAEHIERMAKAMGGEVQRVQPSNGTAGPNLVITFKGTGRRKVMLLAHMDTVYVAGTAAARPFRIEGNRAIAPGIADDKSGIAVFLHAFKLLKAAGFADYERVTMVFNTDEERGSSGSRDLIRQQAEMHDAVLSGEPTAPEETLVVATSGAGAMFARVNFGGLFARDGERPVEEIADLVLRTKDLDQQVPETRMNWTVLRADDPAGGALRKLPAAQWQFATITWTVRGKASHAGVAPHLGVNAVVETASLVRRVSEAAAALPGAQVHWRSAGGGQVGNVIPDRATAVLEVAVPAGQDLAAVTGKLAQAGMQVDLRGAQVGSEIATGLPPSGGSPDATVRADVRVPTLSSYRVLEKLVREKADARRFASSGSIALQGGIGFPPFNATPEGLQLARLAVQLHEQMGGRLVIGARIHGATDAAWAGQSGKPVLESLGLPGGNYHSSDEEFVLVDRIPRRLALVAEMIKAIARMP
jgi:acetylornithine deacetylase/succinyl-diaminopimelate desuccinylase-like protein